MDFAVPRPRRGRTVVAVHGGAYIDHPNLFHWLDYAAMARNTGATVIVPIYPVLPQGGAATVVPCRGPDLRADRSARGRECQCVRRLRRRQFALAAVQELVRRGDTVPSHMVLISPALDLTFSNPAIQFVDDPILNVARAQAFHSNGPTTSISPIRWSVPCTGHWLGCRRPRSTSETWTYSPPMCLSSKTMPWRRRAPTSPSSSARVKYTTGRSSTFLPETQAVRPDIYQQLGIGADVSLSSPNVKLVAGFDG